MPSIALLAPAALLLATAGALQIIRGRANIDRIVLGVGSAAAIVVLIALWVPVRSSQELNLGQLGSGAPFDLRLDAVGFAFTLMILVPAAILLTLQPRPWQEATVAMLALAPGGLAVKGGGQVAPGTSGGR